MIGISYIKKKVGFIALILFCNINTYAQFFVKFTELDKLRILNYKSYYIKASMICEFDGRNEDGSDLRYEGYASFLRFDRNGMIFTNDDYDSIYYNSDYNISHIYIAKERYDFHYDSLKKLILITNFLDTTYFQYLPNKIVQTCSYIVRNHKKKNDIDTAKVSKRLSKIFETEELYNSDNKLIYRKENDYEYYYKWGLFCIFSTYDIAYLSYDIKTIYNDRTKFETENKRYPDYKEITYLDEHGNPIIIEYANKQNKVLTSTLYRYKYFPEKQIYSCISPKYYVKELLNLEGFGCNYNLYFNDSKVDYYYTIGRIAKIVDKRQKNNEKTYFIKHDSLIAVFETNNLKKSNTKYLIFNDTIKHFQSINDKIPQDEAEYLLEEKMLALKKEIIPLIKKAKKHEYCLFVSSHEIFVNQQKIKLTNSDIENCDSIYIKGNNAKIIKISFDGAVYFEPMYPSLIGHEDVGAQLKDNKLGDYKSDLGYPNKNIDITIEIQNKYGKIEKYYIYLK